MILNWILIMLSFLFSVSSEVIVVLKSGIVCRQTYFYVQYM